ncbi:MAG: glycosyltransferase family 39 protein [Thermodesulfobacteriota bacterium]|nr:glycosyltransferase family 39 protein [Thermodesulfobacteriota bacterium]
MNSQYASRIDSWFRCALLAGGLLYVLVYIVVALLRIQYPFELEWLEGALLDHVRRIVSGKPLYTPPSLEFVPFVYPPLYFYLSAALSKVVGLGFVPLRLVSFAASLGSFVVIFLLVRKETESTYLGMLSSCLFAATFRIGGAWFDIGRVDSLFIFFFLVAVYFLRNGTSAKWFLLSGILFSLSFLTKQTALVISAPVLLYCLFSDWRRCFFVVGTVGLIIGTMTLLLDHIHHGWYSYYFLNFTGKHFSEKAGLFSFWSTDVAPVSIAFVLALFYLLRRSSDASRGRQFFHSALAVGMIGGPWICRLDTGSFNNVVLPAYACISILFGLAMNEIMQEIEIASLNKQYMLKTYIYLVCMVQFLCLVYNPLAQIPSSADLEAGNRFVNEVRQMKGDVFIPYHPYLATMAGKGPYAHYLAAFGVVRGKEGAPRTTLINETRQAIRQKRFAAIILDSKHDWFHEDVEASYTMEEGSLFIEEALFRPVTGGRTRPEFVYVPRSTDTGSRISSGCCMVRQEAAIAGIIS